MFCTAFSQYWCLRRLKTKQREIYFVCDYLCCHRKPRNIRKKLKKRKVTIVSRRNCEISGQCWVLVLRKAEPMQLSRRRQQLISIINDDDIYRGYTSYLELKILNFLGRNLFLYHSMPFLKCIKICLQEKQWCIIFFFSSSFLALGSSWPLVIDQVPIKNESDVVEVCFWVGFQRFIFSDSERLWIHIGFLYVSATSKDTVQYYIKGLLLMHAWMMLKQKFGQFQHGCSPHLMPGMSTM